MRNFQISATLGVVEPKRANIVRKEANKFITKGTSATLDFNLMDKVYSFNQIKQLTLVIKEANGSLIVKKLYNESIINDSFTYLYGPNYNYIRIGFSPEETANMMIDNESVHEVELAVVINGNYSNADHTIIERLESFIVLDSFYSKVIGE